MDLRCDERPSEAPFIDRVWRSRGLEDGGPFVSIAETHCSVVVTKLRGKTLFTIRGPETTATPAYCPPDAEFVGIMFKVGAFMPQWPPSAVRDRQDANLPEATGRSFWLDSSAWEYPAYTNVETFVARLVRRGLLVHDPDAEEVLNGRRPQLSVRTLQRRFAETTGMTLTTARQILRVRSAIALLRQGVPILDVVQQAGYFDQPHLSRALKYFAGLTPGQVADERRTLPLSFLYKTPPYP